MSDVTQTLETGQAPTRPVTGWEEFTETEGPLKGLRLIRRTDVQIINGYTFHFYDIEGANLWNCWLMWWRETRVGSWPYLIIILTVYSIQIAAIIYLAVLFTRFLAG